MIHQQSAIGRIIYHNLHIYHIYTYIYNSKKQLYEIMIKIKITKYRISSQNWLHPVIQSLRNFVTLRDVDLEEKLAKGWANSYIKNI